MSGRVSWDEVWQAVASVMASRGLCLRAKVGCVIVDVDQRVVSVSYAGPSPHFDHLDQTCDQWCERYKSGDTSPHYDLSCTSHAEANALLRADWERLDGATIYVSGAVCSDCARLIAQTQIKRVCHRVDASMAYRRPDKIEAFLAERGIYVERWE